MATARRRSTSTRSRTARSGASRSTAGSTSSAGPDPARRGCSRSRRESNVSKSEQLLPLVVSSADAGVRITVVDATLAPVAEGAGELRLDLPAGLYACRFQAGASVREQLVSLTPGGSETHVHQDPIEFSSAAPLAKTRTDDADQGNAAAELSRQVHRRAGSGGQLLLFVRDLDHRARSSPARGLTVPRVGGERSADVEEDGSRGGGGEGGVLPWAGCTLELDP